MKIVAVTACPTGIAHTYMAAEQLEKTAKAMGHTIRVETQGAMGIENELSAKDITPAISMLRSTLKWLGSRKPTTRRTTISPATPMMIFFSIAMAPPKVMDYVEAP